MGEKVCVTTYVWGDKYQLYVPIAVYSIKKMYPEYDVIIFLHGKLNQALKEILIQTRLYDKIIIKENTFSTCRAMNPSKAQAFRWVLWDKCFLNYDYIYIIDVDMFYIKEPQALHEQHIYHMKNITGLPFDNMRRIVPASHFPLKERILMFGSFLKKSKFKYLFNYLYRCKKDMMKLSGLHFIDVKRYYSILTEKKIQYYQQMIADGSYLKYASNDEAFLYFMLKELGLDVDKLAAQDFNNLYAHTDFDNYDKPLFRPTHGIHLGIYRGSIPEEKIREILNLKSEKYYKKYMEDVLLRDEDFIGFLKLLPSDIRGYFDRYFAYSGISPCQL